MKTGRSAPRRQPVVAARRCACVLAFVLTGICSRQASGQFAPQPVAGWATRLYPSRVAVVVNADSPESVALGDYYRRARRIPKRNMVQVHIPGSPRVLSAAAFATIRQEIEAHLLRLLSSHLKMALARAIANTERREAARLTQRKLEILRWMGQGKSNREISAVIGISAITLKAHVSKLYRKLDVQNRAEAVARGLATQVSPQGSEA